MRKAIVLLFCWSLSHSAIGQKETDNWYFGNMAGLNFSGSTVVAHSNNVMNSHEGTAVISDRNTGNILFYTNGSSVWSKNHVIMPNAKVVNSLNGNHSSAQSSLIVPVPNNSSLFYIFTTDANENGYVKGLQYSMVDMTLNGGNGDVIPSIKNIPLIAPTCEKLAAVHHANGRDIWVVTIALNTNHFYAYLVTPSGISAPVISAIGAVYSSINNPKAYLKFSPNGQKLFSVMGWNSGYSELFDFNNNTGVVSNQMVMASERYGASFSQNSQVLYTTNDAQVFQYDLSSNNAASILASRQVVGTVAGALMRAVQQGIDGKIYITNYYNPVFLSVINNPNVIGVGCNFVAGGQTLGGKSSNLGLPNFIESYFDPNYNYITSPISLNATISNCGTCTGTATATYSGTGPFSYTWNSNPVQTTQTATGLCPGLYTVAITDSSNLSTDTALVAVHQYYLDTTLSQNVNVLSANETAATYQWIDCNNSNAYIIGATNQSYLVTVSGSYAVEITKNGCKDTSACKNVTITNIEENVINQITVSPNPSNGLFNFSNLEKESVIEIVDISGKLIFKTKTVSAALEINLSEKAKGMYFYKVINAKNEIVNGKLLLE